MSDDRAPIDLDALERPSPWLDTQPPAFRNLIAECRHLRAKIKRVREYRDLCATFKPSPNGFGPMWGAGLAVGTEDARKALDAALADSEETS